MKRIFTLEAVCALACAAANAELAPQRLPAVAASAQAADQPSALLTPYIPRPGQANQGFFSFENAGDVEATVSLSLYDEHGTEVATAGVSLAAGVTRWVNSTDLMWGNARKGVSVTTHETARGPSLWARVQPDRCSPTCGRTRASSPP